MSIDRETRSSAVDDLLCFGLHAASRAMTSRYRILLEPFGVTYPQYLVLLVLDRDGASSLVSIGGQLRLESSTLSPLVRRLEALGLVVRSRSTDDERNVSIELTAAGRSTCAGMAVVPDQIEAATGLTRGERTTLLAQLHRLELNLRG